MTTKWIGPMPDEEYHADPCDIPSLSGSLAKIIVNQSEAHAKLQHPRLTEVIARKPTAAMDNGTMCHDVLLLGEEDRVVVLPEKYGDFKTKAAKDLRDEIRAADKIPMIRSKMDAMRKTIDGVRDALAAKGYDLLRGKNEQVIYWEETSSSGLQVQCRCKIDNWDEPNLRELKTCASAHPDKIQRQIDDLGYAISAAAYTSAIEHVCPELVGRIRFEWLFCELEPPFAVTPAYQKPSLQELGKMQWKQAVDLWSMALETGNWPDYARGESVGIEATPWRMRAVFGDGYEED